MKTILDRGVFHESNAMTCHHCGPGAHCRQHGLQIHSQQALTAFDRDHIRGTHCACPLLVAGKFSINRGRQ